MTMSRSNGKFIVIDGTDGSGKTTQLGLLKERLTAAGYDVKVADFPQYNTKSAGPVEEYLSGKYGQVDEIDAYKASIFYAVDRYDASFQIRRWLAEGKIVLANRYTSANMGHQGCKISNPLERRVFFNWLYDLEYKIFAIPRPDLSLILHVESTLAQQLARERAREDWVGKKNDIHEDSLDHLKKAEQVYLEIADSFPDFRLITCTKDQKILDREEISLLIWLAVRKIIEPGVSQAGGFQAIGHIIGSSQQIVNNRSQIFESSPAAAAGERLASAQLPPAVPENLPLVPDDKPRTEAAPELAVERIHPEARLPKRVYEGDAGYDLFAADHYSIRPYAQAVVSTGLKIMIPAGRVGLIWDKSGLASQGITTLGGVIDSNYRGEIKIIVKNLSEEMLNIIPGQKIAQLLVQAVEGLNIKEREIDNDTERRGQGFGSTGPT